MADGGDATMKISRTESLIMEALWRRGPLSLASIVAAASKSNLAEDDVKRLIESLLSKNAICAQTDGQRHQYSPLISRKSYIKAYGQGWLDRLLRSFLAEGSPTRFSIWARLSDRELAELKALIERLEK